MAKKDSVRRIAAVASNWSFGCRLAFQSWCPEIQSVAYALKLRYLIAYLLP